MKINSYLTNEKSEQYQAIIMHLLLIDYYDRAKKYNDLMIHNIRVATTIY